MQKLAYQDITQDGLLIDIRPLEAGQSGHVKNSIHFNAGNFSKFANKFLANGQDVVFIIGNDDQAQLTEFEQVIATLTQAQVKGYIDFAQIPPASTEGIATIPADDFLEMVNEDGDYTLLDLRHPDEITRPAPEANLVNIPLENLSSDYSTLDADRTIYTLCGSGNRATTAASFLIDKGYKVTVVEGGMKAVSELQE